ncbi:LacI family DNA-binding transcriptional regulator [Cellulomonas marina]|nr:LacI family DNA-binding transcriptional regulator [Cellulomonas marina]
MADLAELAGVSTATVSRVLNGKHGVSTQARQAVLAALDVLGYERPEKLRSRSVGLVGLIVPELSNPVFPAFAQVIETMLTERGYTPLLCTQSPGSTTEDQYVDVLLEHGVAGIVFVSGLHADTTASTERYERLLHRNMPVVFVNGAAHGIAAPTVSTDDAAAIDLAVRHLVQMGHRSIGLAIGPGRFLPAQRKRAAFLRNLAEHLGVEDGEPHVVSTLYTVEGGQAAAQQLFASGHTAVVCSSDLMALGAVRAARSMGLQVPGDVSVVGFDDSPLVAYTDPPLTTVRQPVQAMGHAAVSALVAEINRSSAARTELLFQPELIVRGSTGPAPRTAPGPALPDADGPRAAPRHGAPAHRAAG